LGWSRRRGRHGRFICTGARLTRAEVTDYDSARVLPRDRMARRNQHRRCRWRGGRDCACNQPRHTLGDGRRGLRSGAARAGCVRPGGMVRPQPATGRPAGASPQAAVSSSSRQGPARLGPGCRARQGEQSIAQVARSFGISESCVIRWLKIANREDGLTRCTRWSSASPTTVSPWR